MNNNLLRVGYIALYGCALLLASIAFPLIVDYISPQGPIPAEETTVLFLGGGLSILSGIGGFILQRKFKQRTVAEPRTFKFDLDLKKTVPLFIAYSFLGWQIITLPPLLKLSKEGYILFELVTLFLVGLVSGAFVSKKYFNLIPVASAVGQILAVFLYMRDPQDGVLIIFVIIYNFATVLGLKVVPWWRELKKSQP